MDKTITFIQSKIKEVRDSAAIGRPIKKIKAVYYGDPIVIPQSNLPCIIVTPGSQTVTTRGTRYDNANGVINIKYVTNIKDTLGNPTNDKVEFVEKGVLLFSETDENNNFVSDSLVGLLRENHTLGNTAVWSGDFSLNYEFTDLRDFIAFEANMSINILALNNR